MNGFSSIDMSTLIVARRVMLLTQQAELRRKDPNALTKDLKELIEEDEALLNTAQSSEPEGYSRTKPPAADNTDIHLGDLFAKLDALQKNPGQAGAKGTTTIEAAAVQTTQITTELKVSYSSLPEVEGLVKRSKSQAETDRYLLEFSDPITFKITDKWTGKSTTIWGDPHVDTNDQEGNSNGEFSDMTGSDSHTTLQLMDGTRITFTAKDRGVIEAVDIYKGSQHLRGIGGGMVNAQTEQYLFSGEVDAASTSGTPMGDVVRAGGDGNDWFTQAGLMIWGKTTGPTVFSRPAYMVELEYRQEIVQQSAAVIRVVNA